MHTTFKSECPSRKSPRAADPNKMTHSKFVAANSFSLFTNSVSFASVESISASIFISPRQNLMRLVSMRSFYQLPEAPPPPLLPPPNPPKPPPPPPHPLEPPPNPPPPQPPRGPLPEFASIPSRNQAKPLPPPPPGRLPEKRPIT